LAARRWFEAFADSAASDSNVLALIAVGSAVRSNVQSDDLDLVVVCRNRKLFRCRAPVEVDVHAFEAAQLETMLSSGHPLLGWAVRLGRAVFDRHGYWRDFRRTWHEKVPLPDPALARHRAARVARYLDTVREMGDEAAASELNLSYLTLLARAMLSEHRVYPASRPELPDQLRAVGEAPLADQLEAALRERSNLVTRQVG